MLHRLHTVGLEEPTIKNPIIIYRTRGIYAWAPEEVTPPNWAGTACAVASPIPPATTPAAYVVLNPKTPPPTVRTRHRQWCELRMRRQLPIVACQSAQPVPPDVSAGGQRLCGLPQGWLRHHGRPDRVCTTTLDAGVPAGTGAWTNQLDDVLQGANTAACTGCHQDGATAGHANQKAGSRRPSRTGGRRSSTQRSELMLD
jgi:hypothetical protein